MNKQTENDNQTATLIVNDFMGYSDDDLKDEEPNLFSRIYVLGSNVYQYYKAGIRIIILK